MRTLHSFVTVCVFGAVAALVPACGSSDSDSGGAAGASAAGRPGTAGASSAGAPGAAGAGTAGAGTAVGDAAKGATVYNNLVCGSCHGSDAKGFSGPNITASVTAGIGSWTYQQFHDALRTNRDKDGRQLCVFMSTYAESDISEPSMVDLWAYLRSLPVSDVVNKGTSCP